MAPGRWVGRAAADHDLGDVASTYAAGFRTCGSQVITTASRERIRDPSERQRRTRFIHDRAAAELPTLCFSRIAVHTRQELLAMQVRPLHDRILVQRLEEGEQNISGIIIPDSAKEKPQRGTVIAAGTGRHTAGGARISLELKQGDAILFGKFAGQEVRLDGVDYLIMKEDEVLAAIGAGPTNGADSAGDSREKE
jgi:chaperonin GroES